MRLCSLFVVALLLLAAPVDAQRVIARATAAGPMATAVWTMDAPVAAAQAFTYALVDNARAPIPLTTTCALVAAVTQCSAPITPLTAGSHVLVLTATSSLGSASSAPVTGTVPTIPTSLTITLTLTVPIV